MVPIVPTRVPLADTQQQEINRLINQLSESEHRFDLGCDEEIHATRRRTGRIS